MDEPSHYPGLPKEQAYDQERRSSYGADPLRTQRSSSFLRDMYSGGKSFLRKASMSGPPTGRDAQVDMDL